MLADAERVVHDLTKAFAAAVEDYELQYPTRLTLWLRAESAARLLVEVHDSPENSMIIAESGRLVSDYVERIKSARCGQHTATPPRAEPCCGRSWHGRNCRRAGCKTLPAR